LNHNSDSDSFPDLSDSQIPSSPDALDALLEESPKVGNLLSMWENKADKPKRKIMSKRKLKTKTTAAATSHHHDDCIDDDVSR